MADHFRSGFFQQDEYQHPDGIYEHRCTDPGSDTEKTVYRFVAAEEQAFFDEQSDHGRED
jgi:hypothetical protein